MKRVVFVFFALFVVILTLGCTSATKLAKPPVVVSSEGPGFPLGRFAIVQGATSDDQTMINVLVPRLKSYIYQAVDEAGAQLPVEKYATAHAEILLWKVDKLHIKGLSAGKTYTLRVIDEFRGRQTLVDERTFQTLELDRDEVTFAMISCTSDDARFEGDIDPMWTKVVEAKPDMLIFSGDSVYVDSFDFVPRVTGTSLDVWQRFIATFHRLPIYRSRHLIPILATWDDHDYGTNDGDRTFAARKGAREVFWAFYGAREIPGVYWMDETGVQNSFYGFGQRFYLLDNRMFRAPKKLPKPDLYGALGEAQHKWLMGSLSLDSRPTWIIEGTQFFNGKQLDFKESFQGDQPANFEKFIEDLKQVKAPVVFGSGDIHFSEIMRIDASNLGYPTYEVTSSALHSFKGKNPWDNPLRLVHASEFNFLLINSKVQNGGLKLNIEARGVAPAPYFRQELTIAR